MTETASTEFKFAIGDYLMHYMHNGRDGTLVRIDAQYDTKLGPRYSIEYIGCDGESGGSSGAWDEAEFRPISDPCLKAAARLNDAARILKRHEEAIPDAQFQVEKWRGVLEALSALNDAEHVDE